ncbi:hypothetical protein ACFQT0_16380 [Hymenobacter humi]|uniref:Uncharacterized protein n=1 Tax=Hymenobacter humi TaxID=1411620 RepID=A0ABW2U5L4_9BACT
MPRLLTLASCVFGSLGWAAAVLAAGGCTTPAPAASAASQWSPDSSTVLRAAGPQYARGKVWRFFFGKHYRDVWALPVTAPVLRLATAQPGGLGPLQAGGSYQSKTLRLCAINGQEYVLRSVDKDASAALPAGWRRRALGPLMKDQTSAAQPYGAYVAAQAAEAAGVLHTNPRLVYVPQDSALGKFQTRFADALYLLEERPDGNQTAVASFGHSPRVVSTAHMLADIRRQPRARVVARAYLRARLLDMWLGDWSRREDQWRWASFPQPDGATTYRPIPRDRDQAFFSSTMASLRGWFRGLCPSTTAFTPPFGPVPSTASAPPPAPSTAPCSATSAPRISGRKPIRSGFDSPMRPLPRPSPPPPRRPGPSWRASLSPAARPARAAPAVAQRYYKVLAGESWCVGTDRPERFELSAADPGRLRVRTFAIRPNLADSLISERQYNRRDTYQLNVYGLAGNDVFELKAPLKSGIEVHIFDGDGQDRLLNHATSATDVRNVTWHSSSDGNTSANNLGVKIEPNAEAQLTANYLGWLRRYNLND